MPHPLSVFRQKEAYCEKQEALPATDAPRHGTDQQLVYLLCGETFTAPPFLSASIVSADAHHGIQAIMSEQKPNQRERIVLSGDKVRQYIPKNIPLNQTEDYVCKALEHYASYLRKRAERDVR